MTTNDIYHPDNWVVIRIQLNEHAFPIYKVIAGWSGSYTTGDSWRMNSGITRVEAAGKYWRFYGSSGSCYVCHKEQYQLRMNNAGIYNQLKDKFGDKVHIMPDDTDYLSIKY